MSHPLRVAVVGGGIAGLAAAYHLTRPGRDCAVTVFEATDHLGGNAYTVRVDLGELCRPGRPCGEGGEHLLRWADLGVDDFNRNSYKQIAAVMAEIGFTAYRPLEDTTSFATADGDKILTADRELHHGTSNPQVRIPAELENTYHAFMGAAAKAALDPAYHRTTVAQFVAEYRAAHPAEAERLDRVRDDLLYPRISAMYFVDDSGPEVMPLRAVMLYYMLQEGFDPDSQTPPKPDRNYFVEGAESWIRCLATWLESNRTVRIVRNAHARVAVDATGVSLHFDPPVANPPGRFDKVVMACHADDALRSIEQGLTPEIAAVLGRISYTNSRAVCHTDAEQLPIDRNAWRTYNVPIRQGVGMKPYRMTYVMNRLQNDAAQTGGAGEPDYDHFGMPQFFVSLNPEPPVPDERVLRIVREPGHTPGGYTRRLTSGETAPPRGWQALEAADDRAVAWFKHNVLDFDCLDAQEQLPAAQGGEHGRLFLTGGWAKGAGLHEECWLMGETVAKAVLGEKAEDEHRFRPEAGAHYAPRYLREAHQKAD